MKQGDMVLIDWLDTSVINGWQDACNTPNHPALCHSVGFWIDEDEEGVTVSFSRSDQGLVMEKKTIPKGCVKSIKKLRVR